MDEVLIAVRKPQAGLVATALQKARQKTRPDAKRDSSLKGPRKGPPAGPVTGWPKSVPAGLKRRFPKMTTPEAQVWWYCVTKLKWREGEDFLYQRNFEGQASQYGLLGSTSADFFFPSTGACGNPALALYVNGLYWHYERQPYRDIQDTADKMSSVRRKAGIDVIAVDEDHLNLRLPWIMYEALFRRRDHSRMRQMQ